MSSDKLDDSGVRTGRRGLSRCPFAFGWLVWWAGFFQALGVALVRERFWTSPEDAPLLAATGCTNVSAVFDWHQGDRLDKAGLASWRQRWRVRLSSPTQGEDAKTGYLKRFERPGWKVQLGRLQRGLWRTSVAGVEWTNARRLAAEDIACARVMAFGEQMIGPVELRSFVLLDEVSGCSLERWVPSAVPSPARETDWRGRRALIDSLARFVGRLHAAGFVHRDLYLSHVFITRNGTEYPDVGSGPDIFALIDLQRVFRPRWRKRRWIVKDLAALAYSAPVDRVSHWDRLRFLSRYLRVSGLAGKNRRLARLVGARTDRLTRRLGPVRAKSM
jgi:hypothetical protein